MDRLAVPATRQRHEVEWLHWLFVRDGKALCCDVDTNGDGLYTVSLLPLWNSDDNVTETFATPHEAMRRHAQIAKHLHASGWLLADSGAVKPAA